MRVCILISGAGTTMQAILEAVKSGELDVDVTAVVANEHVPGLEIAQEEGIPTIVVSPKQYKNREEWCKALLLRIQATGAEMAILAGFMRILSEHFVESIPTLNTHPALLPAFPGAQGVKDALAYGVKVSGATTHWVDAGVDTGPIVAQVAVSVEPHDTEETLKGRIQEQERVQYVNVLKAIAKGDLQLPQR